MILSLLTAEKRWLQRKWLVGKRIYSPENEEWKPKNEVLEDGNVLLFLIVPFLGDIWNHFFGGVLGGSSQLVSG